MCAREAMKEARHIAIVLDPEDEMPMVAHDAVRKDLHRALASCPEHELQKIVEFGSPAEQQSLVVAAVDDVNDGTGWQFS